MNCIFSRIKMSVVDILRRLGYRVVRVGPFAIFDFENFMYRHLEIHKSIFVVQIGANDGVMNDPVYKFNVSNKDVVSGFLLEPLPDVFDKLVINYKCCPNIQPLNLAIHSTESEMFLHRVRMDCVSKVSALAHGIASFDESHWKKSTLVQDESFMEKVKVKCVTFSDLVKIYNIDKIDLLLLDTEGYDYEILMSINFDKIRPRIIRFEHGVRDQVMSAGNFMKICQHLNLFGYQIIAEKYDATAYLLDIDDLVF